MREADMEIVTIFSLLLANVFAGVVPMIVVKKCFPGRDQEHACGRVRALAFFLHLGAGAFMALCLVILLPHSRQMFQEHEHTHLLSGTVAVEECPPQDHHHEDFPIPELVILCGFFATFALQELFHYVTYHCRRKGAAAAQQSRVRFCSCAKRHTECSRTFKADSPEQTIFGLEKRRNTDAGAETSALFSATTDQVPELSSNLLRSSILSQPIPNYGSVATLTDAPPAPPLSLMAPQVVIGDNGDVAILSRPRAASTAEDAATGNVLLVIALSYSSLYWGLRAGRTLASSSWGKLVAGSLQQVVVSFVVGCVGLSQTEVAWPALTYVLTLSTMAPLGVALSVLLDQGVGAVSHLLWGVAEALVCGALLYLTFCDLLRRSQMREYSHVKRFVAFIAGSAVITALQYVSVTF